MLWVLFIELNTVIWSHGIDMFHDHCKMVFVLLPLFILEEESHLYGQSAVGCLKLPDHYPHLFLYMLVAIQIFFNGSPVTPKISNIFFVGMLKVYGFEVDIKTPLHQSTVTLLHTNPVLERSCYKLVRRDGNYGVVEVSYLNRTERYVLHNTVGRSARHCYPVPLVYHIVACQPYTCYETSYRILEYQLLM